MIQCYGPLYFCIGMWRCLILSGLDYLCFNEMNNVHSVDLSQSFDQCCFWWQETDLEIPLHLFKMKQLWMICTLHITNLRHAFPPSLPRVSKGHGFGLEVSWGFRSLSGWSSPHWNPVLVPTLWRKGIYNDYDDPMMHLKIMFLESLVAKLK